MYICVRHRLQCLQIYVSCAQAASLKSVQEIALAAQSSFTGKVSPTVAIIASASAAGKRPQNIERDMTLRMWKTLGINVKPYMQLVDGIKVAIILPHEVFAEVTRRWPDRDLLGSGSDRVQFWDAAASASGEWFLCHPLRSAVSQ